MRVPAFVSAIVSGVVAVGILSGMLVVHAWPLWTGENIYLKVRPVDPRDLFRGDYVTLGYDIDRLQLRVPAEFRRPSTPAPDLNTPPLPSLPEVDPIGDWWRPHPATGGQTAAQRQHTVYLQLRREPSLVLGVPAVYVPVSLSDHPVDGAVNLAGRVSLYGLDYRLDMDFGIDALFVREGTGRPIERAILDGTPVHAEVAVTRRGAARVRGLIINGERTP